MHRNPEDTAIVNVYLYRWHLQLHVGDQNPGANEYDFKRALDILHLAVSVNLLLLLLF